MDDDTIELIHLLCTRAGMIMEDALPTALHVGHDENLAAKIAALADALERARVIVAAAAILCRDDEPTGALSPF